MEKTSLNVAHPRMVWLDGLRFVAIFAVVCAHCCDPFNMSPEIMSNPHTSIWGAIYGSAMRPCVPLFVMMTGLLLLPVGEQPVHLFYKKRILRVLVPFLLWSVLYALFPWVAGVLGGDTGTVGTFYPYAVAYGKTPSLELHAALLDVARIPVHFSDYAVHMWYIYVLIGLYLVLPFFSAWVEKYGQRAVKLFLGLWTVSLLLPYVGHYLSNYFWGTCSWNAFGMLYYFAGLGGYLLLGYYLNRYVCLSTMRTWLVAVPLFAAGYAITFFGFSHMVSTPQATENMIELFWTYCSPNVMLMTLAVFLVGQRFHIRSPFLQKRLANLTQCGFGIYMIHYFFVGVGFLAAQRLGVPVPLLIPVAALLVFGLSWALVAGMYRIAPKAARWVMG